MIYKPKARKDAFLVLYQWDMKGEPLESLVEEYISANRINISDQRRYIRKLVRTYMDNSTDIDKLIAELSEKWDIDRVGYIERNILRIALAEFLYIGVKNPKLTTYDYVKLAQKYAGKKSARFINGILGRVVRERLSGG
ncbi:transcription antitermination factor NusB [Pampinifervens florentissimum]|uniref:transcription antitermination factor NusB n=1 Tax=Pampinifervens florentissimum TaxID=1632019 RepID=UPI0013B4A13A|nr:transcription antitermination factor NusB [Hydrogenobacter sp. T-8]QID33907.1 transcription antitermination factor NusB [Hydrogenobacter sp. T-8]